MRNRAAASQAARAMIFVAPSAEPSSASCTASFVPRCCTSSPDRQSDRTMPSSPVRSSAARSASVDSADTASIFAKRQPGPITRRACVRSETACRRVSASRSGLPLRSIVTEPACENTPGSMLSPLRARITRLERTDPSRSSVPETRNDRQLKCSFTIKHQDVQQVGHQCVPVPETPPASAFLLGA